MTGTQWYWDGEVWTDHVAPISSPAAAPTEDTEPKNATTYRLIALLGGVAIIIGSVGPWADAFLASRADTEGDGVLMLILGVLGTLLVLAWPAGSRWLILASALGIIVALVGAYDIRSVTQETSELFGREVHVVSVGWGLWGTPGDSLVVSS
jgi:hypothetical protein